jgi:ectoine hydroxylase-related dioxygenase (phytanoyl-CoA dioxygenase family)
MTEQVSEHIGWHRETFYGPNMEKSINLWTPLKGVDRLNTLRFISESQLIPDSQIVTKQVNDDHTTKGSTGNKVGFLYSPKVITGGVDLTKAVPMLVPEDHTAIFSGNLIHGAASNFSQTIRFSIDFRIMPFSAYDPLLSKEFHLTSGKPYFLPY